MSKMFNSVWGSVVGMISGGEVKATFKSHDKLDSSFNNDYSTLHNLLEFVEKLYENSKQLKDLMSRENENSTNINNVMNNLRDSINDLGNLANSASDMYSDNEESKISINTSSTSQRQHEIMKESVGVSESTSKNDRGALDLVYSIEEGLDLLKATIDSIERRIKYKKALETTREDLSKLNSASDEPIREKTIKEQREKSLKQDIEKIDANLKGEVEQNIQQIEKRSQSYISKLVNLKKSHLGFQKEQWKSIAQKFSA